MFAALSPALTHAGPFSLDDVEFWVGAGSNRSALVIDWVEDSTELPALVWGYRWDGSATGRDMLLAVVEADDRLFAKLGGPAGNPNLVYGLGYDASDDGAFHLDDETVFDDSGIALGTAPFFPAAAVDADDFYAEGWTFAFWHYGTADSNPFDGGTWTGDEDGMIGRELADGSWDSWAIENSTAPPFDSYAENPQAAEPPLVLPGDYDHDGNVDQDDYTRWRNTYGSMELLDADGNGDGTVGAADYTVWRNHLGDGGEGALAAERNTHDGVPEPSSALLALIAFAAVRLPSCSHRQEIA